jgi:hypothetical protein
MTKGWIVGLMVAVVIAATATRPQEIETQNILTREQVAIILHQYKAAGDAAARKESPVHWTPDASRNYARQEIISYKWTPAHFDCLNILWTKESNWRTKAENKSSGAYGIPQALPAEKMSRFGNDYRINPQTQIKWGLLYIKERYKDPCQALSHHHKRNWY